MVELNEKTTLITGSTKGIGRAIAEAFVAEGARVVVHGRSADDAEVTRQTLGAFGAVAGDLASAEGSREVLSQLEGYSPVEILINNAGVFSVEDFFAIPDEEWLRYFQTNVMSAVRLSRALLPAMLERDQGRVLNVASEAAIKPLPQMIHYSLTKSALISLSRGLAELTKGTQVTVNSLLPGPTWTEGVKAYVEGLAEAEGKPIDAVIENYFKEHEPTSLIQRFITVEEVAHAAVFLAGNSAVNGSALRAEGGIIRTII